MRERYCSRLRRRVAAAFLAASLAMPSRLRVAAHDHLIEAHNRIAHMAGIGQRLFALLGKCEDRVRKVASHGEPAMLFMRFPGRSYPSHWTPPVAGDVVCQLDLPRRTGLFLFWEPISLADAGKYRQSHWIDLEAGQACVLELESSKFDSYLFLLDPAGRLLSRNDNGGEFGPDARIDFTPKVAGSYSLTVTTTRAGETGPYTLRIRRFQAPLPEPRRGPPGAVIPDLSLASKAAPWSIKPR
jgi:hypothetical protein